MRKEEKKLDDITLLVNYFLAKKRQGYRLELGQRNDYWTIDKYIFRDRKWGCQSLIESGTAKEMLIYLKGVLQGLAGKRK